MRIVGIVAEYNPFHNGHLYQVQTIKKELDNPYIVAIMSGSFVQRGEPAIIDKVSRSKIAIDAGVDLVLELPVICSLQSAENFAVGAVRILDATNVIDYISFGMDASNFEHIKKYALHQVNNEEAIKSRREIYLSQGYSFAKASTTASKDLFNEDYSADFYYGSNNILAIEYIKALTILNSNIEPMPIVRKGNKYLDDSLNSEFFTSATAIRKELLNTGYNKLKGHLTPLGFELIKNMLKEFHPLILDDIFRILKYKLLISNDDLSLISGFENGLDNMLKSNIAKSDSFDEFLQLSVSKRYKQGRLQRLFINYLIGISKDDVDNYYNTTPEYVKAIAFNNKGREIISKIKENIGLKIITNYSQINSLSSTSQYYYNFDVKSSLLFGIKNHSIKSEYENNAIYIKNNPRIS